MAPGDTKARAHVEPMSAFLDFTSCFPFLKSEKDSDCSRTRINRSKPCIFCHVSPNNGFDVVWEDKDFIAFHDYRPAAEQHLQVIPKSHIGSVKDLEKADAKLVRSMEEIGHKLLDDIGVMPSMRRMGFHIPPYNSVNHLHLHVHGLPYKSFVKSAKYPIVNGRGSNQKGFSWFVEAGQAIRILEGGERVGVFPC